MPLPPVLKHVTTPGSSAVKASIASSLHHLKSKPSSQDGRVPGMYHNLFVTAQNPPLTDATDQSSTKAGSSCLVAEHGINFRGHMHKTPSLDFLVVHKGQITLHLEGGVKQSIGAGEAIVQRGTVHAWENETDEWVRMFVVLVAAKEEPE